MIRDRIVVGLRDVALSEKLQTDPELTLNKAITMARQTEAVREQQSVVRGDIENSHTRVETVYGVQSFQQKQTARSNPTKKCTRCGKSPTHPHNQCPAHEAKCRKCKKQGHYESVCRSTATMATIQAICS